MAALLGLSPIEAEILAAGGKVPLARFLELALSHPRQGYYPRHARLGGRRGDFTTVPTVSPDFCRTVAWLAEELIVGMAKEAGDKARVAVIELGPGVGSLARMLLATWDKERPEFKDRVQLRLVEISDALRRRQERALAGAIRRGWQVEWFSSLKEACFESEPGPGCQAQQGNTGGEFRLVISNEFLDSLPVHLLRVQPGSAGLPMGGESLATMEAFVEVVLPPEGAVVDARGNFLRETWGEVTERAWAELALLFGTTAGELLAQATGDGYLELRPAVGKILAQVTRGAKGVCVLTVDYGEWFGIADNLTGSYQPALRWCPYRRTLRGYFRHQRVEDLFVRVGRQDLTADVDFRALDLHGRLLGYETLFCVKMVEFLSAVQRVSKAAPMSGDLLVGKCPVHASPMGIAGNRHFGLPSLEADRRVSLLRALLDPADLGGAFKVMLQVWERGPVSKREGS